MMIRIIYDSSSKEIEHFAGAIGIALGIAVEKIENYDFQSFADLLIIGGTLRCGRPHKNLVNAFRRMNSKNTKFLAHFTISRSGKSFFNVNLLPLGIRVVSGFSAGFRHNQDQAELQESLILWARGVCDSEIMQS